MNFVKALCPNCNGILEVDRAKECAICSSCGTPFIVEKAVIDDNVDNKKLLYDAGVTFLIKLLEYEASMEKFTILTNNYPDDWRFWFGLSISEYFVSGELKYSEYCSSEEDKTVVSKRLFKYDKYKNIVPEHVAKEIGDGIVYLNLEDAQKTLQNMDLSDDLILQIPRNDGFWYYKEYVESTQELISVYERGNKIDKAKELKNELENIKLYAENILQSRKEKIDVLHKIMNNPEKCPTIDYYISIFEHYC